jgi:hypothetical protein
MTVPTKLAFARLVDARRNEVDLTTQIRLTRLVDANKRLRRTKTRKRAQNAQNRDLDASESTVNDYFETYIDELLEVLGKRFEDLLDDEYDRVQADFPEFLSPRVDAPAQQSKFEWRRNDVVVEKGK